MFGFRNHQPSLPFSSSSSCSHVGPPCAQTEARTTITAPLQRRTVQMRSASLTATFPTTAPKILSVPSILAYDIERPYGKTLRTPHSAPKLPRPLRHLDRCPIFFDASEAVLKFDICRSDYGLCTRGRDRASQVETLYRLFCSRRSSF